MTRKIIGLFLVLMAGAASFSSAYACNLTWPHAADYCHEHCKYNTSDISRFICELGSKPSHQ
ncbi:hypothetical protein J2125_000852 [Erwinia toletana]|uniref:Uncharacterized protein n=1 Tax=Winslowiella toletana TaxID=92490 RepID=A0ABS4P4T8_9GAMM|nr:hypothetical protein [Winslowiella toletana]